MILGMGGREGGSTNMILGMGGRGGGSTDTGHGGKGGRVN